MGPVEAAATVAAVDALLAAFVMVQLQYLFGGADLVRVVPGLTRAEYARQGAVQLCAVAALAVSLVLAVSDARRLPYAAGSSTSTAVGVRAGRVFSVVLIGLVFVVLASAWQRLRLYTAAYGLTESRVYAAAVIVWIAMALVWCALTIGRGRRETFALGALVAAYGVVFALHAVNPAAYVVRVNVDRSPTYGLDAYYVASLGADAVPAAILSLPRMRSHDRCLVAKSLEEHWRGAPPGDWRSWNWSRHAARQAILAENDLVLRACGGSEPPTIRRAAAATPDRFGQPGPGRGY
jgi:hypothetical protein